jgi:hypothetical protein
LIGTLDKRGDHSDSIDMRIQNVWCYLEKNVKSQNSQIVMKTTSPSDGFPPKIALLEAKRYGEQ